LGSDYSIPARVQNIGHEIATILDEAIRKKRAVYLDLFSGQNMPVTRAIERRGFVCVACDTLHGSKFDLCSCDVQAVIVNAIRNNLIQGVSIAAPCGSWSTARRGKPGGKTPPPLRKRNPTDIYGLENLSTRDQERVALGNATMRSAAVFVRACRDKGTPVMLENGITSMLWYAPEIREHLAAAVLHTTDYCKFGTPWRKRTRFALWNGSRSKALSVMCSSKGSICDVTGIQHVRLTGWSPDGALTRDAEEYPLGVAEAIAEALCNPS
jgi:hypothetical protein